jgi:hypothetical protein
MAKVPREVRAPEAIQGRDLVEVFTHGGDKGEVIVRKEEENACLRVHWQHRQLTFGILLSCSPDREGGCAWMGLECTEC